jgi:hypothetical protein
MIRVSVRRTFLDFEERADGACGAQAGTGAEALERPRARSADEVRGTAVEQEAVFRLEQYEFVSCGARRASSPGPQREVAADSIPGPQSQEAAAIGMDAPSLPPAKPLSKMFHVVSNCSVSTMASSTDDVSESKPATPYMAPCNAPSTTGTSPKASLRRRRASQAQAPDHVEEDLPSPAPQPRDYCHVTIPRHVDFAEEFRRSLDDPQSAAAMTTLMLRHIPNRYTQRELLQELDELGFSGTFDFLYLPLDKGTMSNVGYAFVNFLEPSWAEKCLQVFQSHNFRRHRKKVSGKTAAVSYAHIQGLEANLRHYQKAAISTVKQKQRRPVVLTNGVAGSGESDSLTAPQAAVLVGAGSPP